MIKLEELRKDIQNCINPECDNILFSYITTTTYENYIEITVKIIDGFENIYNIFKANCAYSNKYSAISNVYYLNNLINTVKSEVFKWIAFGKTSNYSLSLQDAYNAAKIIKRNKYENRL